MHTQRSTKQKKQVRNAGKLAVAVAGLALGLGVPAVMPPAVARAADVQAEKVGRDKLPDVVARTFDQYVPAGAKVTEYVEQNRDGKRVYVANFTAGGQKLKLHVRGDGSLFEPSEVNEIARATGQPAPAVGQPLPPLAGQPLPPLAPAVQPGAMTADQARVEIDRLRAEEAQLVAQRDQRTAQIQDLQRRTADLQPRIARGEAAAATERSQLDVEQQRLTVDRDRLSVEIARDQQRERDVAALVPGGVPGLPVAPAAAPLPADQIAGIGAATNDRVGDAEPHYTRIPETDVPPEAFRALERYSANGRDRFYRREEIGGRTSYSVHYLTADNKRYWASAYPTGDVRVEPKLSIYQPEPAAAAARTAEARRDDHRDVDAGRAPAAAPAPAADNREHLAAVGRDQVPGGVLRELDKHTRGMKDVEYRRETQGDRVSYSAFYLNPQNQRYWVSVNENGTIKSEPRLSVNQPDNAGDARTAAAHEPAREPARNADEPVKYTRIGLNDVPAAARDDISRTTSGGRDVQYMRSVRDGKTYYSTVWTTRDGKKMEARFDETGRIVDGPHAAR